MKSNELRVGNLYTDVCGKVSMWHESSFNHYKNAKVPLTELKPIPLTEDWLIKFGFMKLGMLNSCYVLSKIKLDINTLGVVRFHWSRKVVYLDYVHQLQNLYFTIKQKELTIKE